MKILKANVRINKYDKTPQKITFGKNPDNSLLPKLIINLKNNEKKFKKFIDEGKNIQTFFDDFFKLEQMKIFDRREFQIMFWFLFMVHCLLHLQ